MDETHERDSLGMLNPVSSPRSNGNSQRSKPQNEHHATEVLAGRPGVLRAIRTISDQRGTPWGRDEEAGKRFVDAWEHILGDMPAQALQDAVLGFLKRPGNKWPQPGDLRELARQEDGTVRYERHGYKPPRPDYTRLSPAAKAYEGVGALMELECSLTYIEHHVRDRAKTLEMVAKVNAMTPEQMRKLGIDDHSLKIARAAMGGVEVPKVPLPNLEGASPEFLDLIGASGDGR